jgi:hypothetical protein
MLVGVMIFDAIGGNVLAKGFPNKKMQCGSVENDYHKMHIEETNEYFNTICGIYQCYLVLFNCQYHSHVKDIHILIVTNNDLLTNVNISSTSKDVMFSRKGFKLKTMRTSN